MPEQTQSNSFDLKTHHFDGRGRLKGHNPYRLHIDRGTSLFERPVNSGNVFYENNEPAGRVDYTRDEQGRILSKKFDAKAVHKAYVAPLSNDQKLVQENEGLREKTARLEAELAAINAEKEQKKAELPPPPKVETKPAAAAGSVAPAKTEALISVTKSPPELPEI